ncbi:hypothetical protein [Chryseobacterium sp.]|uniref:hypothetical protein n=1 Tax=Chryseobacterium sp. TaxID=1871047 RepID=UPI0035C6CC64
MTEEEIISDFKVVQEPSEIQHHAREQEYNYQFDGTDIEKEAISNIEKFKYRHLFESH